MLKEIVILDDDKAFARARIAELEKEILGLGPEFYEVFNQSSETWHDNAPFDALRDRQSLLDAELQQLKRLLRSSAISVPKVKRGTVGIGSSVVLGSGQTYRIAGNWTPYAGQKINDERIVSCETPVAQALLDKRVGDDVAFGRTKTKIAAVL